MIRLTFKRAERCARTHWQANNAKQAAIARLEEALSVANTHRRMLLRSVAIGEALGAARDRLRSGAKLPESATFDEELMAADQWVPHDRCVSAGSLSGGGGRCVAQCLAGCPALRAPGPHLDPESPGVAD